MEADPYEVTGAKEDIQRKGSIARKIMGVLVVLAILFVIAAVFLPSPRYRIMQRMSCTNNLKSIGLALLNYEQTYGVFPPEYTVDAAGKPLHSWRTLILPFLEEKEIYDSIDLNKPWDDPVNQKVWNRIPKCYSCPAKKSKLDHTYYQAVVTDKSAIQKTVSHSVKEITDGPASTLLIFESSIEDAVPWMKPTDADWSSHVAKFAKAKMPHEELGNVLFSDGSVGVLSTKMNPRIFDAFATISQGDKLPEDE